MKKKGVVIKIVIFWALAMIVLVIVILAFPKQLMEKGRDMAFSFGLGKLPEDRAPVFVGESSVSLDLKISFDRLAEIIEDNIDSLTTENRCRIDIPMEIKGIGRNVIALYSNKIIIEESRHGGYAPTVNEHEIDGFEPCVVGFQGAVKFWNNWLRGTHRTGVDILTPEYIDDADGLRLESGTKLITINDGNEHEIWNDNNKRFLYKADGRHICFISVKGGSCDRLHDGNKAIGKDCLEEIKSIPECEQVSQPTTGPGITVTQPTGGVLLTDTEPIEIGLPAGTTSTTISLTTDEPAVCKYSTIAGLDYENTLMITFSTLATSNRRSHNNPVSDLVDGRRYYVECRTDAGEEDSAEIIVRIDQPPVLTILLPSPPSVSVDVGEQITVEFEVRDDIGISKIMPGNQDGVLGECDINVVGARPHSQDNTEIIIPEGQYAKWITGMYRINCEQPVENYEFLITVVSRDFNGDDVAEVSEGVTLSFVETTAPTTSVASVEGDASEPYYDTIDDGYTDVVINGEDDMTCEWYTSARDYDDEDNTGGSCDVLGDQATCTFSTPTSGDNTYYVACADSLGNGQTATQNLEIAWTVDITPPEISVVYPTEELLPIGTIDVEISVSTDEDATCKYSTTAGLDYEDSSMILFTPTGGRLHISSVSVEDGNSYTYYVKCKDTTTPGNVNPEFVEISFRIADWVLKDSFDLGEDTDPESHEWTQVGGYYSPTTYPCGDDARWRLNDPDAYFQIQLTVTPNKDFKLVWKHSAHRNNPFFEVYADSNLIKTYDSEYFDACSINEITESNPSYTSDGLVDIKFQGTDPGAGNDFAGTYIWIYSSE